MIEILIDNEVVKVDPKLTIDKFQKIQRNPNKYNDQTEILALYLDLEPDELKDLPVEQVRFVESVLSKHMLEPRTDDLVFTFEIDGVTYGLENDWMSMTWGAWVDLEVYSQPDKLTDNIHKILAILYRPITIEKGTKYTLAKFKQSEVEERAELFQSKLGVDMWFGVGSFFFLILKEYTTRIDSSMKLKMRMSKYLKPMLKILPKCLHPKPFPDFISNLLTNSQKKT